MENHRDLRIYEKEKKKLDMRDENLKKVYYLCPCGKVIKWTRKNTHQHKKSKRHQQYIFLDHLKNGDPI